MSFVPKFFRYDRRSASTNSAVAAVATETGTDGDAKPNKDTTSKYLRSEWERETGQEWPKTEGGGNFDVSHEIPEADGGKDGYPNTQPRDPQEHRDLHKANGDFKRWGARAKK